MYRDRRDELLAMGAVASGLMVLRAGRNVTSQTGADKLLTLKYGFHCG
jgi:hypothetical protein